MVSPFQNELERCDEIVSRMILSPVQYQPTIHPDSHVMDATSFQFHDSVSDYATPKKQSNRIAGHDE
jgi:hypothetical protein